MANRWENACRRAGGIALAFSFRLLRKLKPVRERVVLGQFNDAVEREHVARYEFAKQFCRSRTVADIACGSGYGSDMLRRVALSVDSYDREPLCNNILIDLDEQSWSRYYDVIVSFETIEHLARPDKFLENAYRTGKLLLVSTPLGEFTGYNPYHKQTWTFPQFRERLEARFDCTYFFQVGEEIRSDGGGRPRFVIAVARPRPEGS